MAKWKPDIQYVMDLHLDCDNLQEIIRDRSNGAAEHHYRIRYIKSEKMRAFGSLRNIAGIAGIHYAGGVRILTIGEKLEAEFRKYFYRIENEQRAK